MMLCLHCFSDLSGTAEWSAPHLTVLCGEVSCRMTQDCRVPDLTSLQALASLLQLRA